LIRDFDQLSDDDFSMLESSIGQAFGEGLRRVVVRGKLKLKSQGPAPALAQPPSPDTSPISSIPVGGAVESITQPTQEGGALVAPADDKEAGVSVRQTASVGQTARAKTEQESKRSAPSKAAQYVPSAEGTPIADQKAGEVHKEFSPPIEMPPVEPLQYTFPIGESATGIARKILDESQAAPAASYRDLVWRLLYEDSPSLAYHLASYLEMEMSSLDGYPPSWLIRSLCLSRYTYRDDGEMAGLFFLLQLQSVLGSSPPVQEPGEYSLTCT
jgi:hypothetical protein